MSYANKRKERINKIIAEVYKRIDSDILKEATPGIKIGIDDLANVNADQLAKIATKSNVNVVKKVQEAETAELIDVTKDIIIEDRKVYIPTNIAELGAQVEFTSKGNKFTAIVSEGTEDKYLLKDIKKVTTPEPVEKSTISTPEDEKEQSVESAQQENAIFNLKSWATQLQIPINDGESTMNGAVKFTYFSQESQQPINILVLSNGLIKMSGHVIQDLEDFKNITEFHKNA